MRYGHGQTSNSEQERARRREQPKQDEAQREQNRQRSIGGGQPNELGVTQGQNGEQGETLQPRTAYNQGKVRH